MAEASIWESGVAGPPGPPGAKLLLRTTELYIQYSYEGDGDLWTNLVTLESLRGPAGESIIGPQGPVGPPGESVTGPQGIPGTPGADGANGVSVPTIYGEQQAVNNTVLVALPASADPNLNTPADYRPVIGIFLPIPHGLNNQVTQIPDSLQITVEGDYLISAWSTFTCSANFTNLAFKLGVNGAVLPNRKVWAKVGNAGDRATVGGFALVHLLPGDVVALFATADKAVNLTVTDCELAVTQILSTQISMTGAATSFNQVSLAATVPGQTEFIVPGGFSGPLIVALNGSVITEYITSSGTTITLGTGVNAIGDELTVFTIQSYAVADALPATGTAANSNLLQGNDAAYFATAASVALAPKMLLLAPIVAANQASITFTGIPSWAKQLTVVLDAVSTNGTSITEVRIGSGSVDTTGYVGRTTALTSAVASSVLSSGFSFSFAAANTATAVRHGTLLLTKLSDDIWVANGSVALSSATAGSSTVGGTKALSAPLDQLSLTTVNGTDLFDAGSVSLLIEGY